MNRQDFRFFHPMRVRWAEVDMQKIVFNAHYLMYFDTAISDYWRALGLPYEDAMRHLGGDLYVKKATLEYAGSAQFDDRIDIALKCARIGNSSITFEGACFLEASRAASNKSLVEYELIYVFADPQTQTSRPVPAALRALLIDYEAGGGAVRIETGDWLGLGEHSMRLRTAVFAQEQGISQALMGDADDAAAIHAVSINGVGQIVACGRLVKRSGGVGQIGRVAVHRALRGGGIGLMLLQALENAAREHGVKEIMLHAQRRAEGFYQRAGYAPFGDIFEDAGMPHIGFRKSL
jgi:YbgC/YbaW family acyl-CoA thioester hydrolase